MYQSHPILNILPFSFAHIIVLYSNTMNLSFVLVMMLAYVCRAQENPGVVDAIQQDPQELSQQQIIHRREQQIRDNNNMTYMNIKTYTFTCGRFDDFLIKAEMDEMIKFEMHIYWKQENVYISSEFREGEEVRIIVYENGNRVIMDREFYIVTGFSINAIKGSTYTVRFLAAGKINKLISMLISTNAAKVDDKANKQHLASAQGKMQSVTSQVKALLTISQRNFMMKEIVAEKVLSSTKLYMSYEIVEAIIIIVMAFLQISFITRLLKGGSIV